MNIQKQQFHKLFFLFLVLFLAGEAWSPAIAQEKDESDPEAEKLLRQGAVKSFRASSFKMTMDQNISQNLESATVNIDRNMKLTSSYEKPFIYMTSTSKNSMKKLSGSSSKRLFLGKIDRGKGKTKIFSKKAGKGGDWQNLNKKSFMNLDRLFKRFKNPEKLPERLRNVQFDGEETINGHPCKKISASQKTEILEKLPGKLLKGKMKKMISNMEIDVKSSDVNYWLRTSSNLLEKISIETEQTTSITMNIGKREKSMKLDQTVQMTLSFKNYNSTTIAEKHKKTLKRLIKSGGDKKDEGNRNGPSRDSDHRKTY